MSITVIDNDCTGNSRKIVNELSGECPFNIVLIEETRQGIVYARNKAVNTFLKSNSEILIFIDDDEWPADDTWIMNLLKTQKCHACDIVYSDVHTIPENKSIEWVKKAFRPEQSKNHETEIKRFYTNNLLLMRNVLEKINPAFDERFGLSGSSDLHFSIKCVQAGFKAVYTPFAPVNEIFPVSKATMKWFFFRGYRSGEGATRANIYESFFPKMIYIKMIGMGGLRLLYAVLQLLKAIILLDKSLLAKSFFRFGSSIGTFAGFFNLQYNEYKTTYGG